VYLSNGDGSFTKKTGPALYVAGDSVSSTSWARFDVGRVYAGDFNGDGKTDLLRLNGINNGGSTIYLSGATGAATTVTGPSTLTINYGTAEEAVFRPDAGAPRRLQRRRARRTCCAWTGWRQRAPR